MQCKNIKIADMNPTLGTEIGLRLCVVYTEGSCLYKPYEMSNRPLLKHSQEPCCESLGNL